MCRIIYAAAIIVAGLWITSCGSRPTSTRPGKQSMTTGALYVAGEDNTGFTLNDFDGQPEAPGTVYIPGGRAVLGSFEQDLMGWGDNLERTVSLSSFYMDETEIANVHWLEYLHYVKRDSSEDFYRSALPDTTVWWGQMQYNDPYVDHYFRYPGFRFFPVVGVSWLQANDYCRWRTDFVNTMLAKAAGVEIPKGGGRIPLETGVVLPDYRLPTEAEWEYAAKALAGTQYLDENQTHQRIYPWDGHSLRQPHGKNMGMFLANFKRGRGDYAGIAGSQNDGAIITTEIFSYPPNDFGLYNMAGNVSEWVYDVYRPLTYEKYGYQNELNAVRRDGYKDPASSYDKAGYQSLIDDHIRVYKGGSWQDVAYWLACGTRRYMAEDTATATIGFRCCMVQAGTNH